jgi:UDP-N-acetylmuramoyl-L-alanine---L-glutamate ligase
LSAGIQSFRLHRTAIWGFGREGQAALAAIRRYYPEKRIALLLSVAEAKAWDFSGDPFVELITAEVTAGILGQYGTVIKSPGISPYSAACDWARFRGTRIISGSSLWFSEHRNDRTICVTGTKGKSTVCALVAHLLRAAGQLTALCGNIGLPLLEVLDPETAPDWWVIELSSYQTADFMGVPAVAAILNLFPEHLPWHGSEARYYEDKIKILAGGKADVAVLNGSDDRLVELTRDLVERGYYFNSRDSWHVRPAVDRALKTDDSRAGDSQAQRSSFESAIPARGYRGSRVESGSPNVDSQAQRSSFENAIPVRGNACRQVESGSPNVDSHAIYFADELILSLCDLRLHGEHNAENVCAALMIVQAAGFDAKALASHVSSFHPLVHRLQNLGVRGGLDYIDDSIATTPHASVAALKSVTRPGHAATIIVGGFDRGLDWAHFVDYVQAQPPHAVIVCGKNADDEGANSNASAIVAALRARVRVHAPSLEEKPQPGLLALAHVETLAEATALAAHITPRGGTVLLSPGAPSFDSYTSYAERGHAFAQLAGFGDVSDEGIPGIGIL